MVVPCLIHTGGAGQQQQSRTYRLFPELLGNVPYRNNRNQTKRVVVFTQDQNVANFSLLATRAAGDFTATSRTRLWLASDF